MITLEAMSRDIALKKSELKQEMAGKYPKVSLTANILAIGKSM